MALIGSPETSITDYQSPLRNIAKEQRHHTIVLFVFQSVREKQQLGRHRMCTEQQQRLSNFTSIILKNKIMFIAELC
jgi:hypothetical protein